MAIATTKSNFYITGGTIPQDAPSYVERRADSEIDEALRDGEFCYVLTSRQMGKSSLMVRTAARLRRKDVAVAVLDLTAVGQNLDAEQWYDGLFYLLACALGLEEELETYWFERQRLSPLQRWMQALREVVLEKIPGQIVLFIDEIDAVRSLPFSADEFFAAIRECYNRRSEDPEYRRLTFCLLGVARPSDLIRDTRTTPFNIGRRIELTDFSASEAALLAKGLEAGENGVKRSDRQAQILLRRVLHWTSGHPYLTQRLCQAVAKEAANAQGSDVDRLCETLFFALGAREADDNLQFVRERLLRSEADRVGVLHAYAHILSGRRMRNDETNPHVGVLKLSGIVKVQGSRIAGGVGLLGIRNRIYERAFDRRWVAMNTPDAEVRRQRGAYRLGIVRATAAASVVVGLVGALAWTYIQKTANAKQLEHEQRLALIEVGREKDRANSEKDRADDLNYASQMNLAHQAYTEERFVRAWRLLEQQLPRPGQPDRRDFVWYYLWRLCQSQDRDSAAARPFTFPPRSSGVMSVAYSPDRNLMAVGGADGNVEIWQANGAKMLAMVPAHQGWCSVMFSPNGRFLATQGTEDGMVKLWDVASQPVTLRWKCNGLKRPRASALFTPDGKTLIAGDRDGAIRLWDISFRQQASSRDRFIPIHAAGPMALSPDGRTLAVCEGGSGGGRVTLWSVGPGPVARQSVFLPPPLRGTFECMSFSPDGRMLATGETGKINLWDVTTRGQSGQRSGRMLRPPLNGHEGAVLSIAFSPDGKLIASGAFDSTIRFWDSGSGQLLATRHGHTGRVTCVAFSPLGETLASTSIDGTTRLWDTDVRRLIRQTGREYAEGEVLPTGGDTTSAIAFSPDGRLLAEASSRAISIWNVSTKAREGAPLSGVEGEFQSVAFAPDGKMFATGCKDGAVRLWNLAERRMIAELPERHLSAVIHLGFAANGILVTSNGGGSTGAADASVKFWNVTSRQLLFTLPADSILPRAPIAISPDGKMVATGSPDHRIVLWDVGNDAPSGQWRPHRVVTLQPVGPVISLAFSPNGRVVAGGASEGSVYLWNRANGTIKRRLLAHVGPVVSMAFTPDGKTLATGGVDHAVRLWNPNPEVNVDQEEATLKGEGDWLWSVAFSPDGKILATGNPNGTVCLWRSDPYPTEIRQKQVRQ